MADDDYEDDDQDTEENQSNVAADYYQPQQYRSQQDDSSLPVMSQAEYMRMYGGKTTPQADDSNLPVMSQAEYMRMYGGQAQQQEEKPDESELGAGFRSFLHGVAPTVTGAIAGTAVGTAVGGPFGTIPGFLAGAGAGLATGYAASKAQQATLSAIGMDDSHTLALDAQKYPWSTAIGGALPAALTFQPGAIGTTLAQRAGQAGLAGAIDVGTQYATTGDVDPRGALVSAATGFALPGTQRWVERAAAPGAAAMRPWVERFASQRAQADAAVAAAPVGKPATSLAEPLTPEQQVSRTATSDSQGTAQAKPPPQDVDTDTGQAARPARPGATGKGDAPAADEGMARRQHAAAQAPPPFVSSDPAIDAALKAAFPDETPKAQQAAQPQAGLREATAAPAVGVAPVQAAPAPEAPPPEPQRPTERATAPASDERIEYASAGAVSPYARRYFEKAPTERAAAPAPEVLTAAPTVSRMSRTPPPLRANTADEVIDWYTRLPDPDPAQLRHWAQLMRNSERQPAAAKFDAAADALEARQGAVTPPSEPQAPVERATAPASGERIEYASAGVVSPYARRYFEEAPPLEPQRPTERATAPAPRPAESPVAGAARGFTAYHGSPNDFTEFAPNEKGLDVATDSTLAERYRQPRGREGAGPGNIYQVHVKAPRDRFLNLDRSLSEQSKYVRDALREVGVNPDERLAADVWDAARDRDALGIFKQAGIAGTSREHGVYSLFDPTQAIITHKNSAPIEAPRVESPAVGAASPLTITPIPNRSSDYPGFRVAGSHGEVLDVDTSAPGKAQMFNAETPKALRGQGLGVAMYKRAIDHASQDGRRFLSDSVVSADARRVYESLARQGYEVTRNPHAVEKDGDLSTVGVRVDGKKVGPVFEVRPPDRASLRRQPVGPQRGPRATTTEPLPIGKEQAILEAGARRVEEGVPPGTSQPPFRQGLEREEPEPPPMDPPGPPPSNPVSPKGPPRPPGTPPGSPKDAVPPPAEKSVKNVSGWLHDMLDWLRRNRDSDLPKAENDIRNAQRKAGYPVMGWLRETAARLHPYFRNQNDAREQRLYRSVEDRDDSQLTQQDKIYKKTLEDDWGKEIEQNRARVKELQKADGVPAQDDEDEVGFIRRLRKGFQGDQSVMGNDDPLYGAAMRGGDKGTFRERVFHAMTGPDGERLVIGNVTGGKKIRIFKSGEEPVEIDNPYEDKTLGQLHGEKLNYDGKEYTVGNAKAREITAAVPEMQYHESYTASRASELMQTRETLRQAELFHDIRTNPDHWSAIRTFSKQQAEAMKPQPWEQTDVPGLKGVYFDPLAASALNRVYKMQPENLISKLNDIAVSSIFLNPIPHTMNEAYHWAVGRGEDWLPFSGGYKNLFKSGGEAITSLLKRDDDYVAALNSRAPMVNAGRNRAAAFHNIATLAGLDAKRAPHEWDILANKFGFRGPGELIRSIYDASASLMWSAGDFLRLQRIKELKLQGMTTDEAIREMARHQPDYRLPLTIMGSPKVAEFLAGQNYGRLLAMFTRYHYTLFNSLADMVKNAAVGSPDERRKAIGHLMVLGLLAYVAKPYLLDPLAKMITGNKDAEFKPRGPLAPLAGARDYAAGKKDIGQVISGIVTPTPVARLGSELFTNRDWAGRQIINPMSSAPDQLAQALEHLAQSIISPYSTYQGTFLPGGAKGSFANELRDQFLDIKEQTARQKAGQAYGMRQEKSQARRRAQRPGGLIEYGTRQLEQLGR